MAHDDDKYGQYVDHPQYGRGPRYTGLNPSPFVNDVSLHWHSLNVGETDHWSDVLNRPRQRHHDSRDSDRRIIRIPNTAIVADLSRQSACTVPITHYFDVERVCLDCRRPFIFFAEEQRSWYEELARPIYSNCVRCMPCRDRKRDISLTQQRYEELFHIHHRTPGQDLAMVDCCLSLIEYLVFSSKQLHRVRTVLDQLSADADESTTARTHELRERVRSIEYKIANKTLRRR